MEIARKTIEKDEEYLRQISKDVDFDDERLQEKINALETFCKETECFALAAVQIGIPERMVYLKNTTLDVPLEDMAYNESKVLINPTIIERRGNTKYWEACVSCLNYMGLVNRPYKMKIEFFDGEGVKQTETFEGFEATVLSHELDHLDGILHMDVAEELLDMPQEERKKFREDHPYQVISEEDEYRKPKVKKLVKK